MKQKEIVKDIMNCCFLIIQDIQHYEYKHANKKKILKDIGALLWQITRGLVALRRRI